MTLMVKSGSVKNSGLGMRTAALLSGSRGTLLLFYLSRQSVRLADNNDQDVLLREKSRNKDDDPQEGPYTF